MKYLLLAFLLLLFIHLLKEQQGPGVAYYAIQAFDAKQCAIALRVFKGVKNPKLSVLWSSFGDDTSCIDKFLTIPATKTLLIHSTNETCHRMNRVCTKYDQPNFGSRITEISDWIRAREGLATYIVTTGLEDDLSTHAYKRRIQTLRRILPGYVLIGRNPNAKNYSSAGADIIELHGSKRQYAKGTCAYSNDGYDLDLSRRRRAINHYLSLSGLLGELSRAKRDHCISFIWWDAQGGQFNIDWGWSVPRERNIYIYRQDVAVVNSILRRLQK